jgi:hypothetical protein
MHPDLQTYNLSGMGCSAGLISVALARELLENNPGKNCLVVSTEIITQQLYDGNDRGFLVQNTLFRYVPRPLLESSIGHGNRGEFVAHPPAGGRWLSWIPTTKYFLKAVSVRMGGGGEGGVVPRVERTDLRRSMFGWQERTRARL